MARQAASPDTIDPHCDGWWTLAQEELERFAALVAAAEREACISDCNAEARDDGTAQKIAAAIRARGEK
jgi:hypothetical protein